ncbi:MAG: uridine kinase [Congregibacter sp.]
MKPRIIAISGPSGSGKSLFSKTLCEEVRREAPDLDVVLIQEDAYYRDQSHKAFSERELANYDHPDAIEYELLETQLRELCEGRAVSAPLYDYSQHTRSAETRELRPAPVIILEGILLLTQRSIRDLCDMKFFLDTPLDICLLRRIQRDLIERGRSLESIVSQYESTVRPMYKRFIEPSARHADMLIARGGKNRVALDLVRLTVLDIQRQLGRL